MHSFFTLLRRSRLELIAFGAGAIVMILELVGARLIAPYFGTSLYVWTAVIGVILGALAAGYWYGGRLADMGATPNRLMRLLVIAALLVTATMLLQQTVLGVLEQSVNDIRISAFLAALLLFAPASLLLGAVSPYLVRLRLTTLKSAGATVGRLSAAGTLGSIAGTFAAGYFLIALFGSRQLGFGLVVALIAVSFLASRRGWVVPRLLVALLATALASGIGPVNDKVVADVDTAYSRYQVVTAGENRQVRQLVTDPLTSQSASLVGDPDRLLFRYTQAFMTVADTLRPDDSLVIGGGTFTFPQALARKYPASQVVAVEIDPALTGIARQHFNLRERDNLSIVNADGRVYLNHPDGDARFDLVYIDAFSSMTPPYQLMTSEAVAAMRGALKPGGSVVVNVIAAPNSEYLAAVVSTYRQRFRSVEAYHYPLGVADDQPQNVLLVATDQASVRQRLSATFGSQRMNVATARPLTDNYAPVEQLVEAQ